MTSEEGNFEPCDWEIMSREEVADCRVFSVLRKEARHPGRAGEAGFYALECPDWVNVLAVTPREELVLVNQFRFGVESCALEIPGGIVDPGESPLEGGIRELREETGFVGKNARILGSVWPNPAIMNNRCWFVLVEEAVREAEISWDAHEEIQVSVEKIGSVFRQVVEGRISHALVVAGLSLFRSYWEERSGD